MKKLLSISLLAASTILASNAHASALAISVDGPFSKAFEITTTTLSTDTNKSHWFLFAIDTNNASDFKDFSYTLTGGNLVSSFSGVIAGTSGGYFLDRADSVLNFTSGYTYSLVISGDTQSAGTKGFTLTSNNRSTVTAVPEPESYAMLLAGLGLMGTIARRRSSKAS